MDYSKIIAITGLPGLFELISSKSDGGIVRSLEDKSTRFVSSRVHQFSHLESIEVYTTKHNVNLVDVLKAMESSKEKLPDDKDAGELKKYFDKVFPELDQERVYTSDLKKMVKWFAVLSKNEVEIKLSEQPVEEPAIEVVEEKEEKPAKKIAKAEEKTSEKSVAEKKPAKKTTTEKTPESKPLKKSAEKTSTAAPAKKAAAKKAEEPAKKSPSKATEKKSAPKKK
jgi:hypothetical protein